MDRKYHQIQEFVGGKRPDPFTLQLVTMKGGKKTVVDLCSFSDRPRAKAAKKEADEELANPAPVEAPKKATKAKAATKPRKKKA